MVQLAADCPVPLFECHVLLSAAVRGESDHAEAVENGSEVPGLQFLAGNILDHTADCGVGYAFFIGGSGGEGRPNGDVSHLEAARFGQARARPADPVLEPGGTNAPCLV